MRRVTVGHARSGSAPGRTVSGDKAGNQNGRELCFQKWYVSGSGWTHVLRCTDKALRNMIADAVEAAVRNKHIGYDQGQRTTLYDAAKAFDFDPALVKTDVECDCSSLISVACNYAGIPISKDVYTGNLQAALTRTKLFKAYTANAYLQSSDKLKRGDILLRAHGHVACVVNVRWPFSRVLEYIKGATIKGDDVKALQERLNGIEAGQIQLETDGSFGPKTSNALTDVQTYLVKKGKLKNCKYGTCDRATAEALGFIWLN